MNKSKFLQKEHEKGVCLKLLKSINLDTNFFRYGNDKDEPDIIFNHNDKLIGIEVATAYFNEEDAKIEWGRALGKNNDIVNQSWKGIFLNETFVFSSRIQEEIYDKCSKNYKGVDEIWLCIEQRYPLFDFRSLGNCLKQLKIPFNNDFKEIYLLSMAPLLLKNNWTAMKIS